MKNYSPKTLMFYINTLHKGGAQRVMIQLAERFAAEGTRVLLVTSFVDANEYPVPDGVERIVMENTEYKGSRLNKNISRITALRRLIKLHRPDMLISFMAEPNMRAVIASVGLRVKTLISVRNDPNIEYGGRLGRLVGKVLLPMADGCVFQTADARAWFPGKLQKKSRIIVNQVSPSFFESSHSGERRGIVTVGRLNVQKNQALLIDAFSRIAAQTDEPLCIYGIGELEDALREQISALGLSGRVKLMGLSADVASDIKGARLFVLSSDYEGMPNALMEAMALGLPCISSDCPCGGPAELIEDGVSGLLFPVGDEKALSECMLRLLRDHSLADTLGSAAKQRAESFRPDCIFSQWRDYVFSLANGG